MIFFGPVLKYPKTTLYNFPNFEGGEQPVPLLPCYSLTSRFKDQPSISSGAAAAVTEKDFVN